MRKVLIICDVFPPAFAPRMGYLVKYLDEFGWDADILCESNIKDNNFHFLNSDKKVFPVKLSYDKIPNNFVEKLLRLINRRRRFIGNKNAYLSFAKKKLNKDEYKLILISNAWNLFVLYAGAELAREWKMPYVADLRDIYEQKPSISEKIDGIKSRFLGFFKNRMLVETIRLRNLALKNASFVTTVSPFHVKVLMPFNMNTKLIYNGYDSGLFYPIPQTNRPKFIICYTGYIADQDTQDPTLFFEAIEKLIKTNQITTDFFCIRFYTPERCRNKIKNLKYYPLTKKYIEFLDYVEYSQVPEILRKSSILLLLTNLSGENGPKGVMTTKFFEYLGVERPILCVRSDESYLEDAINQANAGIAARNEAQVYNYLLEKLEEWKHDGFTSVNVNKEFKRQFSRKFQTEQFVEIFNRVISTGY